MLKAENVAAVRIAGPKDVRRAAEAFHRIVMDATKLRVAVSHNIAEKCTPVDADGAVLARDVFGWGDSDQVWWKNARVALDSPLTIGCRFASEPFWVNADGFRSSQPNRYLQSIDLSNFEKRALTWAAIVAPVHLPFGQIGAASFNPTERSRSDLERDFETHGEALGMLARTFISSYVHAMGRAQRLSSEFRLSKREVECLRWAAVGKTDQEISQIMARSRATVRFHIHNASTKLDAVNRSQTVFKAGQLGYIGLNT